MRTRTTLALLGSGMLSAALVCSLAAAPAHGAAKAAAKAPAKAAAKGGGGGAKKETVSSEQASRAIGELSGKFKWGMSPKEVMEVIDKEYRAKYEPRIFAEKDPTEQDKVRKEMKDKIDEMRNSYITFKGQKSGWDVSIVDREYGHRNEESMLVIWEKDQRRFMFFWNERLYKQFMALNAEKWKGTTFDQFADIMQSRYGKAQMSFAKMQTQDEMALDFIEWPTSGDYLLRAYDQTGFYGNFCLSLIHKSVNVQVEKDRAVKSPPRVRRTNVHVVDTVSEGASPIDPNADVVDEIIGKRTVPSVEQKRIQERVMKEYGNNRK